MDNVQGANPTGLFLPRFHLGQVCTSNNKTIKGMDTILLSVLIKSEKMHALFKSDVIGNAEGCYAENGI